MAEEVPKLLEGQDKTENRLQELEQENQKMREANAQLEVQVSEMEAKCKEAESDLHNSIQYVIWFLAIIISLTRRTLKLIDLFLY